VVSVFDVVEHDDAPWMVMEYVPSRTLAEIINEDGPLAPERAARIGAQVADGLAAAHAGGVVHRDVKPGNVLVTEDDVAKVSDFGIARRGTDDQLTSTGMLAGTPSYLSPELARGGEPAPASDVWALGVTLYTAVEGHPPYPREENPLAMLQKIIEQPPPRPRAGGPLTEPIARMMDADPRSRWGMADVSHALRRLPDRVAAPEPAAAPEPVPLSERPASEDRGRPPARASRHWPRVAAVALVMLAVLAAGVYLLAFNGPDTGTPASPPAGGQSATPSGPTASGTPTPSRSPSPHKQGSTSAPRTGASLGRVATVNRYFAAMPGATGIGWTRLAPSMRRSVGRGSYESFWGSVDAVQTSGTTAVRGEQAVLTTITYHMADGRVVQERHRIALQRVGGRYLIADDQLLSSRTVSG
jgi:serine/threonine protein kinase